MTAIEWTDVTWNPVRGCSRVSPGCENCYAERQAARPILSAPGKPYHGLVTVRSRVSGLRYDDPGAAGSWTAPRWTGKVVLDPEALAAPLKWKKPRRVFVNSMSDMFHESLTDEQIAAVFGVMAATPQHTYQVLTKRAERAVRWFEWVQSRPYSLVTYCIDAAHVALGGDGASKPLNSKTPIGSPWPLRNVWLGVSVEDQQRADERIPYLLRCPAAVRFLSVEPMIGPVDLSRWLTREAWWCPHCKAGVETGEAAWHGFNNPASDAFCPACDTVLDVACGPSLSWVIVGGESGPGSRPCNVEWIRSIVRQCRAALVPVFVKQLGAHVIAKSVYDLGPDVLRWWDSEHAGEPFPEGGVRVHLSDSKGGDHSEWPEDLRGARDWPATVQEEQPK